MELNSITIASSIIASYAKISLKDGPRCTQYYLNKQNQNLIKRNREPNNINPKQHFFSVLDERETVQKKTFTKWINSHLQKVSAHINDLYHDLQDGRNLILLLEILSAEKLVSLFLSCPYPP